MSGATAAPGASFPPALTHAVAVLRVRPVARVAVAGVVRGARDALSVATDVLVQSALVCLCEQRPGWGPSIEHLRSATSPGQT